MKQVLMSIFVVATAVAAALSCQKVKSPVRPRSVALYTHPGDTMTFEAGKKGVTIAATCDWTVASGAGWITVSPQSGPVGIHEVVLTYTENTDDALRSAGVVFTAEGGQSETYVLIQDPKE